MVTRYNRGYTLAEVVILLWGVVVVAGLAGLVYVAIHFIAKLW